LSNPRFKTLRKAVLARVWALLSTVARVMQ
jgi:hypothetical protein